MRTAVSWTTRLPCLAGDSARAGSRKCCLLRGGRFGFRDAYHGWRKLSFCEFGPRKAYVSHLQNTKEARANEKPPGVGGGVDSRAGRQPTGHSEVRESGGGEAQ